MFIDYYHRSGTFDDFNLAKFFFNRQTKIIANSIRWYCRSIFGNPRPIRQNLMSAECTSPMVYPKESGLVYETSGGALK